MEPCPTMITEASLRAQSVVVDHGRVERKLLDRLHFDEHIDNDHIYSFIYRFGYFFFDGVDLVQFVL